jgi:hypothetical protein
MLKSDSYHLGCRQLRTTVVLSWWVSVAYCVPPYAGICPESSPLTGVIVPPPAAPSPVFTELVLIRYLGVTHYEVGSRQKAVQFISGEFPLRSKGVKEWHCRDPLAGWKKQSYVTKPVRHAKIKGGSGMLRNYFHSGVRMRSKYRTFTNISECQLKPIQNRVLIDVVRKKVLRFHPSALVNLKVVMQIEPLAVGHYGVPDTSQHAYGLKRARLRLPCKFKNTLPPWSGIAGLILGAILIFYGLGDDMRPGQNIAMLFGIVSAVYGFFVLMPGSVD